ncbi:hypothetical protein [Formosa haliotis]|uniref:hypothetical protein n=1 Tax=Formosa haliotis TaxID=1555194 RepID=UPI00114630E8|nr:hypothetical protein [Formosa haliotis]
MATCYLAAPLKHTVFNLLHIAAHYIEDKLIINEQHSAPSTIVHTNNILGHLTTTEAPPLANHSHTATGKIVPNYSHRVLVVLDGILSASEEQQEHQKSLFKSDIDKHLLTSKYHYKTDSFTSISKQSWYAIPSCYEFYLVMISPPPKYIS